MAIKRYVHNVLSGYCYREPKRKEDHELGDDVTTSVELSSSSGVYKQQRDSVVSIVMAGGIVELYAGPVAASTVMAKHPGLCLARPEVFSQPCRSVVSPRERLFPGNKFYLVPQSTIRKLQRNAMNKMDREKAKEEEAVEVEFPVKSEEEGCGEDDEEAEGEFASMARGFYVSKEKWTRCFTKRFAEQQKQQQQQKPLRRSISMTRMHHGLLLGWKPSLRTIKERSP